MKTIVIKKSLFIDILNTPSSSSSTQVCERMIDIVNEFYTPNGWNVISDKIENVERGWHLQVTARLMDRFAYVIRDLKKRRLHSTKKGGMQKNIFIEYMMKTNWNLVVQDDEIEINDHLVCTPTKNRSFSVEISSPIKMPNISISAAKSSSHKHFIVSKIRRNAIKLLRKLESSPYTVEVLKVRERSSGKLHDIRISDSAELSSDLQGITKLKNIAKISDRDYKKLSDVVSLPKLWQIKEDESRLNKLWNVQPCSIVKGAYISLVNLLSLKLKYDATFRKLIYSQSRPSLKIRLGGDGTSVGRKHNHINFAISIIQECACALTTEKTYPVAIFGGKECYENIVSALNILILELETLVRTGYQMENMASLPVEVFIVGDMKFLLIALGLDGVAGKYPCMYCCIPKSDLSNIGTDFPHRTTQSIVEKSILAKGNKEKFNCGKSPIFSHVPVLDHVVDILHWFLRITDILFVLLVHELVGLDESENPNSKLDLQKCARLQQLENSVKDIGIQNGRSINMHFFSKRGSAEVDWPTMFGKDKLIIFKNLDLSSFNGLTLSNEKTFLWKQIVDHYKSLRQTDFWEDRDISQFADEAKHWLSSFISVYPAKHVTPYMHVYATHFAPLLYRHRSLWPYCQEMFEKFNDISTTKYFRCTNHHDRTAYRQLLQSHLRCLNFLK